MAYRDEFKDKEMGKLGRILLGFAHPVLGNFSSNIQCRLHKKFGRNNYDTIAAAFLSSWTEVVAGIYLATTLDLNGAPDLVGYIGLALCIEGGLRMLLSTASTMPSIVGKLASLPIDISDKKNKRYFYHPEVQDGLKALRSYERAIVDKTL
ncbi:MAG: hypothetical protein KKH88_02515 [Nanoarchaeota archaeon]|nr:hypothetical protein [Nanoarchaeota archaeon]